MRKPFPALSSVPLKELSVQFALVSLGVLVLGMLAIGWWTTQQIEHGVLRQSAEVTAAYIETLLSPYLEEASASHTLAPTSIANLGRIPKTSFPRRHIAMLTIWAPNGHVLYSTQPELTGRVFPISDKLRRALHGESIAQFTSPREGQPSGALQSQERMLEVYFPLTAADGHILAAAEVWLTTESIDAELSLARWRTWALLTGATLVMYLLLNILVLRGDAIIRKQAHILQTQLVTVSSLLEQNRQLHLRVQRAARRSTTLNERFLRRISAELHDGPIQALGLVLLRLDALEAALTGADASPKMRENLNIIRQSLKNALHDIRAISHGLRLPELQRLSLPQVILRAVTQHERRTNSPVRLELDLQLPAEAPEEIKIATYRILEEALSNAYRHAQGRDQSVRVYRRGNEIHLQISDQGPGFDWEEVIQRNGHLGLLSMRERAESLGGQMHIDSAPGRGTTIHITFPIHLQEPAHV